jgi:hypothetical protein
LKESGVAFDIKTDDEAMVLMQAINLLENRMRSDGLK